MNRKFIKQLIYGSFYLVIWVLIGLLVYSVMFKPAPSCSDNKKNQNEEDVDCGGVCPACALKTLQPIDILPTKAISAPDKSRASLLLSLRNPNSNYGANPLILEISAYDASNNLLVGMRDETVIYPGEIKSRVIPNFAAPFTKINRIEVKVLETDWVSRAQFALPKSQIRQVATTADLFRHQVVVAGLVKNINDFAVSKMTLHIALYNELSSLVGVSRTLIENFKAGEERTFEIAVPTSPMTEEGVYEARVTVEPVR